MNQYEASDYRGKKLLIIGAGHEQVPAIEIAKSLGLTVLVTDMNPLAPGRAVADVFAEISTADKDENLKFALANRVDGVMTLGSELAVPVVAYVCDQMNLNSGLTAEIALKATNKNAMHAAFNQHQVSCPVSLNIRDHQQAMIFVENQGLPVVIKPSDSSGQKGINIVTERAEIASAVTEAISFSSDGAAIIEEYIAGPEINVTAAVINGEINFLSFSHRVTADAPHFGIAVAHKAPVSISPELLEDVRKTASEAIKAIGLKNGIAYPQIIASETQGARVLEIAARIPGGHMREVALLLSGVDMIEVAIDQALGLIRCFDHYQKYQAFNSVYVHFLTELDYPDLVEVSSISGFRGLLKQPDEFLTECRLSIGDSIPKLSSSSARFASLICAGDSSEQTEAQMQSLLSRVRVA